MGLSAAPTSLIGGGDRTRTCIAFRPAVFKTAALPLCDPSALAMENNITHRQATTKHRPKSAFDPLASDFELGALCLELCAWSFVL